MKIRESGMPEQDIWDSFFDPQLVLSRLGLTRSCHNLIELGCGYGTFTIPASHHASGTVYALDIDSAMLAIAAKRAEKAQRKNIEFIRRDFVAEGTGLPDACADYVMLFNILHHEHPVALLREARRNLSNYGLVGIMHWIPDPKTPRGPRLEIRPRPADCIEWAERAGFYCDQRVIDLPPYHFGLVLRNAPDATASSE